MYLSRCFIVLRCYKKGSIHSVCPTHHFESSLNEDFHNSTLWDDFYNKNICPMSQLFVFLSYQDCVSQLTLSIVVTLFLREADENRRLVWSSNSLQDHSHQAMLLRASMLFWESSFIFTDPHVIVSYLPDLYWQERGKISTEEMGKSRRGVGERKYTDWDLKAKWTSQKNTTPERARNVNSFFTTQLEQVWWKE